MHEIICPHCLRSLRAKDIEFKSEDPNAKEVIDEKRAAFMKMVDVSSDERDSMNYFPPVLSSPRPNDQSMNYPPMLEEHIAGYAKPLQNYSRVCGYCHFELPVGAGEYEMIMIGMCGGTNAGKTVYLLSLIRELPHLFTSNSANALRKVSCELIGGHPLTDRRGQRASILDEMYSGVRGPDLEDYVGAKLGPHHYHVLPQNTSVRYQPPAIFRLSVGEDNCLVVLYDIAGEALTHPLDAAMTARYLTVADGIIYLIDDEQPNSQVLLTAMMGYIKDKDRTKPCHIAFTASKADKLLEKARNNNASITRYLENVVFSTSENPHREAFDWRAANWVDALMRPIYDLGLRNTRIDAEQYFRDLSGKTALYRSRVNAEVDRQGLDLQDYRFTRYFAISALGRDANVITIQLSNDHIGTKSSDFTHLAPAVNTFFLDADPATTDPAHQEQSASEYTGRDAIWEQTEPTPGKRNQLRVMNQMPVGVQIASPIAWLFHALGKLDAVG